MRVNIAELKKACKDGPTLDFAPRGACRGVDPDLFYVARGQNFLGSEAAKVCDGCPVSKECLAWGVAHEKYGVWGGATAHERLGLRKRAGVRLQTVESEILAPEAPCGTDSAYLRHLRRKETPCGPCTVAHAVMHNPEQNGWAARGEGYVKNPMFEHAQRRREVLEMLA